jgi:beta-glucosidase
MANQFPDDFLWGTATSAHQVEGGNDNNDWWDWEHVAGHIKDGSRSGLACDHYRRYPDDFKLLASLGQNAHRLSIEWSRVEPQPGQFDPEALAHYRHVLETLRGLGLEPVVTLHHFTNPRWLARQGGWTVPETVEAFVRYVERCVDAYGDLVRYWTPINEPAVYAYRGFVEGDWPPGRRSPMLAYTVLGRMLLAHARAYHVIHRANAASRVGLAHHIRLFDASRQGHRGDRWAARLRDFIFNRLALLALRDGRLYPPLGSGRRVPRLRGTLDFLGVNYYTRERVVFDPRRPQLLFGREVFLKAPRSLMGWEIYPEGLYRAIRTAAAFGPVLVTENGIADQADELRPTFLLTHLRQVARALSDGLPVLGYLHWSALDNFEWTEGFDMRFGLIHVDYATQHRSMKPSAELYGRICRTRSLPDA